MQKIYHVRCLGLAFLFIFLAVGVLAYEQTKVPGPSFEEVISIRSAGGPVLSPDGKWFAKYIWNEDVVLPSKQKSEGKAK